MARLLFSVLTRSNKRPKTLDKLINWVKEQSNRNSPYPMDIVITEDATSIYEGHKTNLEKANKTLLNPPDTNNPIVVLCHDDIEILSCHSEVYNILETLCLQKKTGFVGVAGSTRYDNYGMAGAWWAARNTGETRGIVFQGNENTTMTANWFGISGQVICLDGLFMAISYEKLKLLGFEKPHYITSNWDFYDISNSFNAHLKGFNNYVAPIIVRHDSPGTLRDEWVVAKNQFCKYNAQHLPVVLNHAKTHGLPL